MSDSIGQISLDLGLNDVTESQISDIGTKIKANVTKALSGLNNIGSIDKTLGNIQATVEKMIDSIHSQIQNNLEILRGQIEDIFSNLKVKNPMEDLLNKDDSISNQNDISPKSARGPPSGKTLDVRVPKVDLSNNTDYIKSQITNLTAQLDQIGSKADEQRAKIKELRKEIEELSKPTGSKPMNFINQEQIKKLQNELSKAEQNLTKFAATSDKTVFTIDALEKKLDELGNTANDSANKTSRSFSKFKVFPSILNKLSNSIKSTKSTVNNALKTKSNINGKLKRLGHTSTNTGRSFLGMGNMISRSFNRVLRQVFVMGVIYKGLRGLISYIGSALMANAQFSNSLKQVQANLMVAFMPIYQAILPALNALMSALATVTSYIATFISGLFGKTYSQSLNAAKGLNTAKAAMGAYGKSAKKAGGHTKKLAKDAKEAQKVLAGFDEVNTLDFVKDKNKTPNDGASAGDGVQMPDMSKAFSAGKGIEGLGKKVRDVLASIFQPFKNAWAKEGQATIASMKYAFNSILDLLGNIGKSMLTVWTNGTGEKILTVILQILQNIFNIIGDIASTFATAWNSCDIGTKIIQGIANTFLNLLTLVKKIGDAFREVWKDIGTPLANMFMKVLKSTIDVLENLSQKLIYVWDNGGSHLFKGLIKLGAKVLELAGYIYTEFVVPFVNWFVNKISPAIAPVLKFLGWLCDKISDLIDFLTSGNPYVDAFIQALVILGGTIGSVIAVIKICSTVGKVLSGVFAFITSPITLVVIGIAALIAIGILLYKHWDVIKAKAKEVWNSIKQTFNNFKNWLGGVFSTDWTKHFGLLGHVMNGLCSLIRKVWSNIKLMFKGIIDFIAGVFTGNWRRAWQGVVNIFKGIFGGLASIAKAPLNAVIGLVNGAIGGLNKLKIPDWVPGIGGNGVNIPKIPKLARGGILDQPTLNIAGEAGKEAVVPLENNTQGLDLLAEKLMERLGGTGGQGNNSNSDSPLEIVLELGGSEFARFIIDSINKLQRQEGRTLLKI
ncbi:hypothetical protein HAHI6034_05790 [Hathewaya histolytica]|uniref:TMP repeat family n=1 Tax=Hathewaya histolytica TaxID=1498 RepID=A0A4U9RES2_HATHI|nr:hypothetical protein [Hathewaya histolytica]VTQ89696.1 TMP repeat family [Hathewaya histolytica]